MGHERLLGYIEIPLPFEVGIMNITHFCDVFIEESIYCVGWTIQTFGYTYNKTLIYV